MSKRKREKQEQLSAYTQDRMFQAFLEKERFIAGLSANDLASLCAASHGRETPNEADKTWAKRRRQEARKVVGAWLVPG